MSRYGHDQDYRQGERDFEIRGRRSYQRDRYPSYGSPDHDYEEGFKHAEREEELRQEEREEREAQERREEEQRAERRRQEYWEMERLRDEEQYQSDEEDVA